MVNFREISIEMDGKVEKFYSLRDYHKHQIAKASWLRKPFVISEQNCDSENEQLVAQMIGLPKQTCKGLILIFGNLMTIFGRFQQDPNLSSLLCLQSTVTLKLRDECRLNRCIVHKNGIDYAIFGIAPTSEFESRKG